MITRTNTKTLHGYQSRIVREAEKKIAIEDHRAVLVCSPTGSGKSIMCLTLLRWLVGDGPFKSAIVAVPQNQIKESFSRGGKVEDRGPRETNKKARVANLDGLAHPHDGKRSFVQAAQPYVKGRMPMGAQPVIVCSHAAIAGASFRKLVDGLKSLLGRILVIDEGHHSTTQKEANAISKLRAMWLAKGGTVIVMTATPYRADGTPVVDGDWHRIMRSMADHIEEGYAPAEHEIRFEDIGEAGSAKEFEDGARSSTEVAELVASKWAEDGQPKAVFIVPGRGSQAWAKLLGKALRKRKPAGEVFDATGASGAKKAATLAKLESESGLTHWDQSTVAAFIACKRFDEGTDWPICSHVYVIGYPGSIALANQRWGRASRNKAGIAGHKHPGVASITYFHQRWKPEFDKELRGTKTTVGIHRWNAHLIAALRHDPSLAPHYIRVRGRLAAKYGEERSAELADALELDDGQRKTALVDYDTAMIRCGFEPGEPITGAQVKDLLAKVEQHAGRERADAVAVLIAEQMGEVWDSLPDEPPVSGSKPQVLFRREVIGAMRSAVDGSVSAYSDDAAGARLAMVCKFTGESKKAVADRLHREFLTGIEYEDAIAHGAMVYIAEHGRRPSSCSGDSLAHTGLHCTWNTIDTALRRGEHDTAPRPGGLSDLLDERGIGEPLQAKPTTRTEEGLREAILGFWHKHGRAPSTANMATWAAWCRAKRISFVKVRGEVLAGTGAKVANVGNAKSWGRPRATKPALTLEAIEHRIEAHNSERGQPPACRDMAREYEWCKRRGISFRDLVIKVCGVAAKNGRPKLAA